jgi:hypothetical protein
VRQLTDRQINEAGAKDPVKNYSDNDESQESDTAAGITTEAATNR